MPDNEPRTFGDLVVLVYFVESIIIGNGQQAGKKGIMKTKQYQVYELRGRD
jgi:hypothetical protein